MRAGRGHRQHRQGRGHPAGHRRHEHARRQHGEHGGARLRAAPGRCRATSPPPTRASATTAGTATSSWACSSPARRSASWGSAGSARRWPSGPGPSTCGCIGFDPFLSPDRAAELGIELVDSVRGMLPEVDYLTVHTPLTDETRHLVGMQELDVLKPGVRLVNCARGGIYDEQALAEGLDRGRDRRRGARRLREGALHRQPAVRHAGRARHAPPRRQHRGGAVAGGGGGRGPARRLPHHRRDPPRRQLQPPIDPAALEGVRGFLDLAWRLGLLLSQLDDGQPRSCSIAYRGEIAARNTRLVTAAFAAGPAGESPSRTSTSSMRRCCSATGASNWSSRAAPIPARSAPWWRSTWSSGDQVHRAAGTLFGHSMPRLVQLEGHRLEAYLDGILLVFTHQDVPGIIGRVGTAFGEPGRQHRPDDGRAVDAGRRRDRRAEPRSGAVGRGDRGRRRLPGRPVGPRREAAAGRPVAQLAGGLGRWHPCRTDAAVCQSISRSGRARAGDRDVPAEHFASAFG